MGDTTTTFSANLAAYYHQIPVGHVKAGLRTWNKYSTYPEEMNRQLTGVITDLHAFFSNRRSCAKPAGRKQTGQKHLYYRKYSNRYTEINNGKCQKSIWGWSNYDANADYFVNETSPDFTVTDRRGK